MFSARQSALERLVDQAIYWALKFGKEVLFVIASGTARSGMAGDRFSHSASDFSFGLKIAPLVAAFCKSGGVAKAMPPLMRVWADSALIFAPLNKPR